MNPSPGLIDLLNQLKRSALASEFAENNLLSAMENLLVRLNSPDNNADMNCKQVDYPNDWLGFKIFRSTKNLMETNHD